MASVITRQSCNVCDKDLGIVICVGCHQCFCRKHYDEHQEEFARDMNNIKQKYDEIHSQLTIKARDSEDLLLSHINEWEQRSINRIHTVANEARTKLKQSLDPIEEQTKTSLSRVGDQLRLSCASKNYSEIELKCWMEQLESFQRQLPNQYESNKYEYIQKDMDASIVKLIESEAHWTVSKLLQISHVTLHHVKHSSKISVYSFL
jgi:hypothetical protein